MSPTAQPGYRVGVVGCGRKGTSQARAFALHPLASVVAAADPDPENLQLFCARFAVPGYDSYREMLEKERIDIASVVLPVGVNPEVVIGCARAGVKAVFSEKPISVSLEEADRMVEACRERGIPFAGADMFRNFPQYWKGLEMIRAGELGPIQSINLYQAGDSISGAGCQGLSLLRMFACDAGVERIAGWVNGIAAEDSEGAPIVVDEHSDHDQGMGGCVLFKNGIEAFIHCRPGARRGIEVVCSEGVFASDNRSFHLWKVKEGTDGRKLEDLEEIEGLFPASRLDESVRNQDGWLEPGTRTIATTQSLIDALELGIEPRCSGEDLRQALEIAVALRESHRRGFSPVELPLQDRSLKIIPKKGRLLNKKEVYGGEWYAEQIGRHKK